MTAPDPRPALPPRPSQMNGAGQSALPPRPSQMNGAGQSALPPRPSQMNGAGQPVAAATARPPLPPRPAPVAKAKPDPRPMRLGLGAGAIAALSIMAAGLVRFPVSDPTPVVDDAALAQAPAQNVTVEKHTRYVKLKPGQKAPPGARVIEAAAPTPRVVVRTIQAAAPRVVQRTVTRTRQSGHP